MKAACVEAREASMALLAGMHAFCMREYLSDRRSGPVQYSYMFNRSSPTAVVY